MKQKIYFILIIIITINSCFTIYGATDSSVLSETVENEYFGRDIGKAIINNIDFSDVAATHWAKEPVTRLGALEVIKGYSKGSYRPNDVVSNEVILTLLIRMIGMEEDAKLASEQIANEYGDNEYILNLWSKGYMKVASDIGLISADDFEATLGNQSNLDPAYNFIKGDPVTREQVAKWIVETINIKNPGQINTIYEQQALLNYSDWDEIGIEYMPYVEAVTINKIMSGNGNAFNPKDTLTRAEMAQLVKNIESILYDTMGLERKTGIVASVKNTNETSKLEEITTTEYLIRNEDGRVDRIIYQSRKDMNGQVFTKDTPVYQDGKVLGLQSLKEGEYIEYIVASPSNEIMYINSQGIGSAVDIIGILQPLIQIQEGKITIKTDDEKYLTYQMMDGLYDAVKGTIKINQDNISYSRAPISNHITLTIQNNIVTGIKYLGHIPLYNEISGIVKENNISFSYITIIDWNGNEITKYYHKSQVQVEKQNYYDENDDIGYIDEMFPDYRFDERDSSISEIEPGDIVHMRMDPLDSQYVQLISAKTNYIVKYGTIKEVSYKGAEGTNIIVEYDDSTTAVFDIQDNIKVVKAGQNVGIYNLQPGDVLRMLINQAVIKPGTIEESVKEIIIDEYGNVVANIYRGRLGNTQDAQRTITLIDAYELSKAGWSDYSQAKVLDISDDNIEYYEDGNRISLSYADNYLRQDGTEVYVVTSNYFGGEKVTKVTFRDGRDSVLDYSNITYSNGLDKVSIIGEAKTIGIDDGTIVIKNGKLVEPGNIMSPDYAQIVLNGGYQAAVVNIEPEPSNDAISLFRGRIESIEDGNSFQVQSHAVFLDMEWIYSPIPRIFNINHNTFITDEEGIIPLNEFISYSELSKVDEVYTIIAEGTTAKYIVKNPYCKEGILGEIYDVSEENIMIKDTLVFSSEDASWTELSYTNSYAQVNLLNHSVIIKNNQVITKDQLEKGDNIKVLTTENLINKLKLEDKRDVNGYIIFVEK